MSLSVITIISIRLIRGLIRLDLISVTRIRNLDIDLSVLGEDSTTGEETFRVKVKDTFNRVDLVNKGLDLTPSLSQRKGDIRVTLKRIFPIGIGHLFNIIKLFFQISNAFDGFGDTHHGITIGFCKGSDKGH